MTVAQLVHPVFHPAHSFATHSQRAAFRAFYQQAARGLSDDVDVWRGIGIGMAFAVAGFAMMAAVFAG